MPSTADSHFWSALEAFGGGVGATSFSCDTQASLVVPAGHRYEVYQIIFSNSGGSAAEAGYGGS